MYEEKRSFSAWFELWVGTIILFPFSATGGPCLNTELKPVVVKSAARQVVLIGANQQTNQIKLASSTQITVSGGKVAVSWFNWQTSTPTTESTFHQQTSPLLMNNIWNEELIHIGSKKRKHWYNSNTLLAGWQVGLGEIKRIIRPFMDDLKGLSAKLHCIDAAFDGQVFIAPTLIFIFHRTTHLHINCFASFHTGQKLLLNIETPFHIIFCISFNPIKLFLFQ